jgi:hypothetical protein
MTIEPVDANLLGAREGFVPGDIHGNDECLPFDSVESSQGQHGAEERRLPFVRLPGFSSARRNQRHHPYPDQFGVICPHGLEPLLDHGMM